MLENGTWWEINKMLKNGTWWEINKHRRNIGCRSGPKGAAGRI
jgi:hypothetical protein